VLARQHRDDVRDREGLAADEQAVVDRQRDDREIVRRDRHRLPHLGARMNVHRKAQRRLRLDEMAERFRQQCLRDIGLARDADERIRAPGDLADDPGISSTWSSTCSDRV
jgi:hypothetical protein